MGFGQTASQTLLDVPVSAPADPLSGRPYGALYDQLKVDMGNLRDRHSLGLETIRGQLDPDLAVSDYIHTVMIS